MEAVHYPERPFLKWQCDPQFPDGHNNYDEFLEASKEIYKVLTRMPNGTVKDLRADQENLLSSTFQDIQDEDIEIRTEKWLKLIHEGKFNFAGGNTQLDNTVKYSKGDILDDKDFITDFYDALDDHFQWVKGKLDEAGLNVLR